jgi:hypothetical protein
VISVTEFPALLVTQSSPPPKARPDGLSNSLELHPSNVPDAPVAADGAVAAEAPPSSVE